MSDGQGIAEGPVLVAGIMSGTSVDGIDVALVRLEGHGPRLEWSLEAFASFPFREDLRDALLAMGEAETVRLDDMTRAHTRLAHAYAEAVLDLTGGARVDLVGCHGQTVRHLPEPDVFCGEAVRATLQLGSGPVLANLVRAPVVSDFRAADMALGGQGAPLVPYVDWVLLGHETERRAALNVGGIANVTVIPAGADRDAVVAFDTGPGNMVIDALCRLHLDMAYDRGGEVALSGTPDEDMLAELLAAPYFRRMPPKSTGREAYGEAYVAEFVRMAGGRSLGARDQVATATALTADSVVRALGLGSQAPPHRVMVSGGGVHNRALLERMARGLPGCRIGSTSEVGLDPDAKEAVAFAVLAHEAVAGVAAGMPRVTGATRAAILGSVSHPA